MIARIVLIVWLTIVWIVLWGDRGAGTVAVGILIGVALVFVFPPVRPARPVFRPWGLIRFAFGFAWRLVVASAVVAWEVVTPRNRINEGIVAVPLLGNSDFVATVVANAVSLTPGTLTLEVDREAATIYIHVLHLHDIDVVRSDVRELERLVIGAFGDAAAIAAAGHSSRRPARRSG